MNLHSIFHNHRAFLTSYVIPIVVSLFISGCGSVNHEPFVKYRTAVQEAQTGIDAAMSLNYQWTRTGFIEEFSGNPDRKFSELIIDQDSGYSWSLRAQPVYMDVKKARSALFSLNQAFASYADLLVKLSGAEHAGTETFDQMAADLNQNTKDALRSFNVSADSKNLALFSTVASEAARLFIESKRQSDLQKVLKENQANVDSYSTLTISLIRTIRGSIKSYYNNRFEPIRIGWQKTSGSERQRYTEAMLALNEQFIDAMRVLQELEEVYSALPKAHAGLADAIKKTHANAEGIQTLYSSAKRLQRLYVEMNKTEVK